MPPPCSLFAPANQRGGGGGGGVFDGAEHGDATTPTNTSPPHMQFMNGGSNGAATEGAHGSRSNLHINLPSPATVAVSRPRRVASPGSLSLPFQSPGGRPASPGSISLPPASPLSLNIPHAQGNNTLLDIPTSRNGFNICHDPGFNFLGTWSLRATKVCIHASFIYLVKAMDAHTATVPTKKLFHQFMIHHYV